MSDEPQDQTPQTGEIVDANAGVLSIFRAMQRAERERARIRPEDWSTLFRQIQDVMIQLAGHPFVKGDMEAEMLIERISGSDDLEELDQRVDQFVSYAIGKLEYNAGLRAALEGKDPAEAEAVFRRPQASVTEVTRAQASHGPSGSDFAVANAVEDDEEEDLSLRRTVFRL